MIDKNQNKQENPPTELEECKKLCDEYLAGWQREKADFINYKKEAGKRTEELVDFVKVQWVLELLRIVDNFDRAIQHKPSEEGALNWAKGVEMIDSQLKEFLKSEGVQEVKALGEKFNPEFHEAVEQQESDSEKSGEIVEVLEKGYTLNNKLIRPAKVKVTK
ncbi:MAG: nucleotide exchange factor GrpE [Candidatus Pacebacteria bacterium]|nr:nucleotide exchange factor GrpE [Candidatus Paceibacterota bacterium]